MTIQQAAAALRERKVSSAELTEQSLTAIERLQPRLNAFITIAGEKARERARRADEELARGIDRGPLHGIPIAVKDVFCTRGLRTTCGSKLFADHVPGFDAAVVERLEAAGAVITGKTNMHELAYGITSSNPHFGFVRNAWNPDHIPGGSSGGSGSAVAAGMVFMAMGSDTGGSIRIPASFCGTVGIKPTFGRVSRYGVMPLDFSLDHMGPLTRSVRDAAICLAAIAGHDPRDETSSSQPVPEFLPPPAASIQSVRIGIPENFYFDRIDPEVETSVRRMAKAAANLGATLVPVRVPDIRDLNTIARIILLAEASAATEKHHSRREDFGADVLALLDQGRLIPATDYVNAQRLRRLKQQEFRTVWHQADCVLTPCTPTPAPKIGQTAIEIAGETEDVRLASTRLVRAINLLGLPALAAPCGLHTSGLPMGMQLIGPPFSEPLLFRVGAALEDTGGSHIGIAPE